VLTAVIIFGFLISVPTLILSVCLCLIWFIRRGIGIYRVSTNECANSLASAKSLQV
jgi:hypothetical protein